MSFDRVSGWVGREGRGGGALHTLNGFLHPSRQLDRSSTRSGGLTKLHGHHHHQPALLGTYSCGAGGGGGRGGGRGGRGGGHDGVVEMELVGMIFARV